ncbi:guanylate kinase [Aphanomyces invadans]|uniref:guanylate kinase n=1 Tax=Aphanomyces invadans TaxID=157072 RepID=A0A024UUR2_9STRA|nr:guanylate kinase [Aphanomyces invadans]ETW09378.1 guanylate kinase [Aphanomyces invadans]|eukprot:XP_008863183.1 guanylate kinase [Aphanomyces invadans]
MEKGVQSLTFEELSILNERKEEIKKDHMGYLDSHPELKTLLSSFMSAVLIEKPTDILAFAKDHFDALKPIKLAPMPLVVSGPSGVGKGTLITRLLGKFSTQFGFSVSHTTRGPREGEENGVAYNFVTNDEFEAEAANNTFLEYAYVHGNGYGTSLQAVEAVQSQEKICVLDIDIQGVQQVKKSATKMKFLFIAPPSMADLEKRLRGRGTETEEKVALRLTNAKAELDFAAQGHFDKVLVNNDLDEAFAELEETMAEWYPQFRFK